jgi:hypothetical protein
MKTGDTQSEMNDADRQKRQIYLIDEGNTNQILTNAIN